MKLSKKIGCILLAVLMFTTSLSVGFMATAETTQMDLMYEGLLKAIAEDEESLAPKAGYPYYVKDLTNYTLDNQQNDWSEEGNTLNSVHTVNAKDNNENVIKTAADKMYAIAQKLVSTTYGEGDYNTQLIAEEIKRELYKRTSGEEHVVRTDSTGEKVFVPVNSVRSGGNVTVNVYTDANLTAAVLPKSATNQKLYWRSLDTSKAVVDQNGRVYAKNYTPGYVTDVTLECITVEKVDVVSPAVYGENGQLIKAPELNVPTDAKAIIHVYINNRWATQEELNKAREAFEANRESLPDWNAETGKEKTNDDYAVELAALAPKKLTEEDAKTIRRLNDAQTLTDADYGKLASFCLTQVQDAVKKEFEEIDVSALDFSNLSNSGLTSGQLTEIHKIIKTQSEQYYSDCGYTDWYHFYHIESLIHNFMGSSDSIHSGNWYHDFVFCVSTDIETGVLNLLNQGLEADKKANHGITDGVGIEKINQISFDLYTTKYSWKHRREFDPSGTVPRYVLADTFSKVTPDRDSEEVKNYLTELYAINTTFDAVFEDLEKQKTQEGYLSTYDLSMITDEDAERINDHYHLDEVMTKIVEKEYPTELMVAAFGKKYYAMTAVYNLFHHNKTYGDTSRPKDGYRQNVHSDQFDPNEYSLSNEKMETLVKTIDALMTNDKLGSILKSFIDFSDPKYIGSAVYGKTFNNASDMLKLLIESFLYSGKLPTLIFKNIYKLLQKVTEETVPKLIDGVEGIDIPKLLKAFGASTVDVVVVNALSHANRDIIHGDKAAIYPYQIGERFKTYTTKNGTLFSQAYPEIFNIIHKNEYGRNSEQAKYGGGWQDITPAEWEIIENSWHVTDRDSFVDAINAALVGILPLLPTLLGKSQYDTNAAGLTFRVEGIRLYEWVVSGLLEAIGIEDLPLLSALNDMGEREMNGGQFEILPALLNPILDWVEDVVLKDPLNTVAHLLVSVDSLLGYKGENDEYKDGYLEWGIKQTGYEKGRGVRICLQVGIWYNIDVLDGPKLYETIKGALPAGAKLDSLNGILKSFVKFKAPIVVSYDEFDRPVFKKTTYDDEGNVVNDKDTTTIKAEADTTDIQLPTIQSGKLRKCGTIAQSYTSKLNAKSFSNVFYYDAQGRSTVETWKVFLYLLRYILYGIMYNSYTDWRTLPSVIDAFIDPWNRTNELFGGLTIDDILNNVVYHPEMALCALMEIFVPNETHDVKGEETDEFGNFYAMMYPDYHQDILLAKDASGKRLHETFGPRVNYTKYWTKDYAKDTIENLQNIVDNVLRLLGKGNLKDLLNGLLNDNLYTSKILSMLANLIYTNLSKLSSDFDLAAILEAAFGVKFDPISVYNTLAYNMVAKRGFKNAGDLDGTLNLLPPILTHMQTKIRKETERGEKPQWSSDYFYASNEDGTVNTDKPIDWGLGEDEQHAFAGKTYNIYNEDHSSVTKTETVTTQQLFFDSLAAILSPFAPVIRLILLGQNISLFPMPDKGFENGVITIPMYQIYHFALVPLFEALNVPGLKGNKDMLDRSGKPELIDTSTIDMLKISDNTQDNNKGQAIGNLYLFEDVLTPVNRLVANLIDDPITTVLDMIPNLMFIISSGTINDILNNLLHFAYVLLDIVKPIVDLKPVLNRLLSGLEVAGVPLNITLPLNIDFNSLINRLLGSFTQGTTAEGALQGAGIEVADGLRIQLPPIDLNMLCAGVIEPKTSVSKDKDERQIEIVHINTQGGADLVSALLKLVMDTLFMYDNSVNLSNYLAKLGMMDGLDSETVMNLFTALNKTANEGGMPDKTMYILYLLLRYLTPITDTLASKFENYPIYDENGQVVDHGISITDFIGKLTDGGDAESIFNAIKDLLMANDNKQDSAPLSFFQRVILFFKRLIAAVKELFKISQKR